MSSNSLSHGKAALRQDYRRLLVSSTVVLAASIIASLLLGYSRIAPPTGDRSQTIPELQFEDATGGPLTLADFRGRVILLNIWATWCGPCRKEMPDLDRLQAELGGPGFQVLAVSIDRGGIERVRKFFDETGIRQLAIYLDQQGGAMTALTLTGVPATLLIDRDGKEIQRWIGPAEWSSAEIVALLRRHIDLKESGETAAIKHGARSSRVLGNSTDTKGKLHERVYL